MNWIIAVELQNWADTLDSQSRFPQLIRRLLHATLEELKFVECPSGEGVQREGWDCFVEAASGNAFVPPGISVWESGVNAKIQAKAEADYKKRTEDPLGLAAR